MEQKPIESSTTSTPPSTPTAGQSSDAQAAPASSTPQPVQIAPAGTDQSVQAPSSGTPSGTGNEASSVPGGSPSAPPPHHGSNAMIYAVITFILVLFGAGVVTYMNNSKTAESTTNTTVVTQPTQPATITAPPTEAPSPSLEEEVETVNVTDNDTDLQQAEKDLQGL